MEWEWRITDESGGDPSEAIAQMVLESDSFKAYRIVVDDEKAGYVEFGTLPSTASPRDKSLWGTPTEVELKFREWVKRKYGLHDQDRINVIAHGIYKDIMQNGMPPIPFMRPAMYSVLDNAKAGNVTSPYLDSHTTKDLADEIVELMKAFLDNNDTVDSGVLRESIQEPEEVDPESDIESLTTAIGLSERLWDSRTEGVLPDRPPRSRYKGTIL